MQALMEAFQCYVCKGKLRYPHLCSHCSKLCCFDCIRRCLANQQKCPQCRIPLHFRDLVKCRWGEEITGQLNALYTHYERMGNESRCATHGLPLVVHCVTCEMSICQHEAIYSGKHNGHRFKTVAEVAKQSEWRIRAEVTATRNLIAHCMDEVDANVMYLRRAKAKALQMVNARMELQLKEKLGLLAEKQMQVSTAYRKTTLLQEKINTLSTVDMILQRDLILEEIQSNEKVMRRPEWLDSNEPTYPGREFGRRNVVLELPTIPMPPPATLGASTRKWASSPDVSGVN